MKKALALILTLIMVLGLMPAAMAATAPALQQQIGHYTPANDTDGTLGEPTESTLAEKTLEEGKVIISKNIAATQTENVFDITLTVKTTEEIKEVTSETADAAVVLVIDISNSMSSNMMANAQKAAQAFINSFAPAEDDKSTRNIAIVAFGTRAHQISGWVEASTLKTAPGEVHSTISGIKPNINEDTGGTNMHAGLLKASELLKDNAISSISNKNVLLFTDGVPTYYINDKGELGSFGNTNNRSQIDHNNHVKVEETVRNNFPGIGKYAVYLGNERIYCDDNDCLLYGYDYDGLFIHHNHGGETVKNWLNSLKSSDGTSFAAYSTSNASELANIFKSISELIKLKAQAWQLTDPMGDNIEFVQFLDANIDNKQATQSGGTISWDLKRDITKVHDDANKAYTYTLSYRIKLNTLSSGFAKDTFYKTNGVTDLTYFIEEQGTAGGLKHAYFNVPSVKGFAGDLTFTKVGANNEPLAGAEFTLTTADKDGWNKTATSGEDGQVKFENIPSGHTYTLTETKTPEGYQSLDGTYTVEVAYGVAVLKKGADTVTAIVNTLKETPTGSLTIEKVFTFEEGEDPNTRPDSITFTVQQIVQEGEPGHSETVTLTPNDSWKKTIDNVPVGEYTVTEGDAKIDGYTYTPVQNPTGNITVAATGTAAVTFTNTYKKLSPDTKEITFNVSKTVEQKGNVAPGTNTFNFVFTIEGSEDAAINNSDYIVTIGGNTITPDATGKYGFPITVNGATTQTVTVKVTGNTAKINNIATLKFSETDRAPEYWTYDTEVKSAQAGDSVTFTNTYTENTVEANGSLTIKKEFGSDSAITADNWAGLTNNKQLTFTITKAGATAGTTVTLPTNDTTNPWTYTVNNLPVGEYTVTESGVEVDGYDLTVSNTGTTTTTNGKTGTVAVTGDETSTITFTNTYEKINADLVVYKNVTGNRGNYSSKAFTFRLTLTQPTFEVVAAGNVAQAPVNSAPPEINYSSPWYRIVRQDGTKEEGSVTVGIALEFNLGNGERLELYANGERYDYEVKETNSLGHDTTVNGNDKGTIDVEKPTSVTFNNYKSGGGHYYPTPDPVPPIVIPPKTGDMTIWQSILHFLGIR